jgi:glutamate-1-semialdehyde 2,1-aminomutase
MQVGTLSGNPIAAAAGLATLAILRQPGAYERLFATGRELMAALTDILKRSGLPAQVIGVPPLFDVVFATGEVKDYRGWLKGDAELNKRLTTLLRERRILKGDSKYYVSLAHTAEDVGKTIAAWQSAVEVLVKERKGR